MGMSVGGGKGKPKSDINITPLIDVILVLLIIFLVTMPIMMRQITIEVPRAKSEDEFVAAATQSDQVTVTVEADGEINLSIGSSEEKIRKQDLVDKVRPALAKVSGDKVVFVDFDYAVRYEEVMQVMDLVAGCGDKPGDVKIAIVDKSLKPGG